MRSTTLMGALIGCLMLVGCGKGPDVPPPSATPTAAATATPTTAPALPPSATKNTKAGAIAFVKHYIETANFALETGRTSDLAALGSDSCKSCGNLIHFVKNAYAHGGSIDGGTCRIRGITSNSIDRNNWQVISRCAYRTQTIHKPDGTVKVDRGEEGSILFVVQYRRGPKVTSWLRL